MGQMIREERLIKSAYQNYYVMIINILSMNNSSINSNQSCLCEQHSIGTQEDRKLDKFICQDNQQKQVSILVSNEDILEEDIFKKKLQNKQKYRKLKQKLAGLCSALVDQSQTRINKQYSSQSKSRLLVLAIQVEKLTLNQSRDYVSIEVKLKELLKILELKRETDLLILKHSKFLSGFSSLLSKIPTFYKNQFISSLKTVELGLKILLIFCTISQNREFAIANNMILVLHNCLGVLFQKQERKLSIECFRVLTQLISCQISTDVYQVVSLSLQVVPISQFGRKMRQSLQSCLSDKLIEEQYVLKSLRYLYYSYLWMLEKNRDRPIHYQIQLLSSIKIYTQSFVNILTRLLSKCLIENDFVDLQQSELPIIIVNICYYIIKILNLTIHTNIKGVQKLIKMEDNSFMKSLLGLFRYARQCINNGEQNQQIKCLFSQIMQFIAKLCFDSQQNKDYLLQYGLIQVIYDHPLSYLIDSDLRSKLIPCLCAVMSDSLKNMKIYLSENSADCLISYLKMQTKVFQERQLLKIEQTNLIETQETQGNQEQMKLVRKLSESSFNSFTTQGTQNSHCCRGMTMMEDEKQMTKLLMILPFNNWQRLMDKLIELQE